ncbi:MAG: hypothetical protein AAGL99_14495 [Pseudomonadota bacterium]
MRCSVTFAEIKEGPNGLECTQCGKLFVAVEEDAAGVAETAGSISRNSLIKIAAGALIAVAMFIWAIVTFAPGQSAPPEVLVDAGAATNAQTLIRSDQNGIVAQALKMPNRGTTAALLWDKGCQRISGDSVETIQWLNLSGDALNEIRPAFPGNWRVHEVCPMERGGAAIATLLNDGVALSQVGDRGDLLWTQIVSVSSPDPEQVALFEEDQDLLLVTYDLEVGQVLLSSYGPSGGENWKQSLSAGNSIEPVSISETSLGDLLIAWREPGARLRLVIISTTGLVIQDLMLDDRLVPLKGAVQDEIGRTLMALGDDQVMIDLISQTGDSERQASLASSSVPIGVMTYADSFLIFALSQSSLMVWGVDASGDISDPIEVEIEAQLEKGKADRLNDIEAIVSLQTVDMVSLNLVIDLRRLANTLEYASASGDIEISELAELVPQDPSESLSDQTNDRFSDPAGFGETSENVVQASTSPVNDDALDPAANDDVSDTLSVSVTEAPSSRAVDQPTPNPIAPQPDEGIQTERPLESFPPSVLPLSDPSQARCTFSCISKDEPIVEYVLMQTVDRSEGENLSDVSLRLSDTHVNLCALSGGEPEPSFRRQCTAG